MSLRESTGNMYGWVSHTWNVIKGRCPHNCLYCYMKQFPLGDLRFDNSEMSRDLGKDKFIFVGSSCDMFAEDIPDEWILKILVHCQKYFRNRYMFQSKNPVRFHRFITEFPKNCILGTTIETNRIYPAMGDTPSPSERTIKIRDMKDKGFETFITIEPIMDFDLDEFVGLIDLAMPTWVNIGADSKKHKIPEPSKEKIMVLIEELAKFTEIKKKNNLDRLV